MKLIPGGKTTGREITAGGTEVDTVGTVDDFKVAEYTADDTVCPIDDDDCTVAECAEDDTVGKVNSCKVVEDTEGDKVIPVDDDCKVAKFDDDKVCPVDDDDCTVAKSIKDVESDISDSNLSEVSDDFMIATAESGKCSVLEVTEDDAVGTEIVGEDIIAEVFAGASYFNTESIPTDDNWIGLGTDDCSLSCIVGDTSKDAFSVFLSLLDRDFGRWSETMNPVSAVEVGISSMVLLACVPDLIQHFWKDNFCVICNE